MYINILISGKSLKPPSSSRCNLIEVSPLLSEIGRQLLLGGEAFLLQFEVFLHQVAVASHSPHRRLRQCEVEQDQYLVKSTKVAADSFGV